MRELERAERMLRAQTSINRDLTTELNDMQKRLTGNTEELHGKVVDLERTCVKCFFGIYVCASSFKCSA